MKFSNGVDTLSKENQFLRMLAKCLLALLAILLGLVIALYDKEPFIVERSSHGLEIVKQTPFAQDESDLQQAVKLMMQARFDSTAISPEIFLNHKQNVLRETEQKDLKSRGMVQNVIVRSVKLNKTEAVVELDRVISVAELRSALKAKIKIAFESVSPTELNPYGLLLSLADPIEQKEERK